MGGESPDLSDLAVYGVLNAIEGGKFMMFNLASEPWRPSLEYVLIFSSHE